MVNHFRDPLGFHKMGKGIAFRAKRYRRYWQEHFDASMECQSRWLKRIDRASESIAILGAGRLFDCAIGELAQRFKLIRLVDADSNCLRGWREVAKKYPNTEFEFSVLDVTGEFQIWKSKLATSIKSLTWEGALNFLEDLTPANLRESEILSKLSSDCVLSLNLLSQIPVMWQNIVQTCLARRFGKRAVQKNETDWLQSILGYQKKLVVSHLDMLNAVARRSALVLTDVEYVYFNPHGKQVNMGPKPKLPEIIESRPRSDFTFQNALFGFEFEDINQLKPIFCSARLELGNSWIWLFNPVGPEELSYNRVRALSVFQQELF